MPSFYREKLSLLGRNNFSKVFLAEGLAEALFLDTLFEQKGFSQDEYCVFCFKGINNFKGLIKWLTSEQNFNNIEVIGIMVDADNNPGGRLDEILRCLNEHDLAGINRGPLVDNVLEHNGKRIGIFISPGTGQVGRIETMICKEVEAQAVFNCISGFRDCLSSEHGIDLDDKAIAQMYVTLKQSDLCGIGRAFQAGVLSVNHDAYSDAVRLFTELLS